VAAECANGFEAVKAIGETTPDLLFLDVQMPKLDGFEVLELIERSQAPVVIFVTAYDRYAMRAFDAHAVDYLLKPFSAQRFERALERARARLGERRTLPEIAPEARGERPHRMVVKDGTRVHVIPIARLDYVLAQDDYVALHSEGKSYLKQQPIAAVEALLDPSHFRDMTQSATEAASVVLKLVLKSPDTMTRFKGRLGVAKRAAWSRPIPVDEVKAVGSKVGGTVNDVLLTAVAGALRRYLLGHGDPADGVEINAMVPVNLRPPSEADQLGNRFGLIYLALPVGTEDRAERLQLVKARMDEIKTSPQPFVTFQILNALGLAPIEVAGLAVNMFGTKATAVMTNVIGPKQPLYFAGERIRTWLGWVPQSGRMGLGVSIFSYDGQVVGQELRVDAGAFEVVPDVVARVFEPEGPQRVRVADSRAQRPEGLMTQYGEDGLGDAHAGLEGFAAVDDTVADGLDLIL